MRTVLKTGLAAAFIAFNLLTATTATAFACNKNFVVYNRTDKTITKLYVAPNQSDNWEDNVLNAVIEPDTHARVDMTDDTRDYSLYDVKAVFEDGSKTTGGKINLCRAQSVYIYDDRVTFENSDD